MSRHLYPHVFGSGPTITSPLSLRHYAKRMALPCGFTTVGDMNWNPAMQLESTDPLLWMRFWATDQGISTGGARQFYSADKTSLQHTDNAFFRGGEIPLYFSLWVNVTAVSGTQDVFAKFSGGGGEYIGYIFSDGKFYFQVRNTSSTAFECSSSVLTAGKWYFIQCRYDEVTKKIGISVDNGAFTETTVTGTLRGNTSDAFSLGNGEGNTNHYNGKLSRVSFLKNTAARAVIDSAATRTSMYNLGRGILSGNLDLLLADLGTFTAGVDWDAWNLNETDGTADARSFSGLNDLTPTFDSITVPNSGFETAGSGGGDVFGSWIESIVVGGVFSAESVDVDAGSTSMKYTSPTPKASGDHIYNYGLIIAGHRYRYSFRAKSNDGTAGTLKFATAQPSSAAHLVNITTSWATYTGTFPVAAETTYILFQFFPAVDGQTYLIDEVQIWAVDIPAANGPSSDIAPDTGSVGTNHGLLTGFADSETARSTDTADGSPNPTVLNAVDNTTYPGLMVGFAAPDTARSAHGLTGVPGKAITFDGTNDYIACESGAASGLNIVGDLTICVRIKTSSTNMSIVAFGDSATGASGYLLGIGQGGVGAGKITFLAGGGATWRGSTGTVNDDAWHHVAVSLSGTTATFYIDGVASGTGVTGAANSWSGSRHIGAISTLASNFYNGLQCDFRLFSTDLTAPQIAAIAAGDSGLTGSPVLRYDFDEADTRTLTTIGAGTSLSFDGTNDYISAPTTGIPTAAVTLSLWFKHPSTANGWLSLAGTMTNASWADGYGLVQITGDKIQFYIKQFNVNFVNSVTTLFDGMWHHAVGTWDGTTISLYIDGVLQGTDTYASTTLNGPQFWIGTDVASGGDYYSGKLDDVRVYSTALSAAQLLQLSQGTEATGATPVSMWTFDEETSLSVTDGDPIAIARSLEGNRYQLLNATASERPEVVKVGLNGKQGLRFDSIDDMLVYTGTILSGTSGSTFLIYTLEEVPNAYQTLLAQSDTATATKYVAFHARGNTANPHIGYAQRNADTEDLLDGSTEVTDNLDCAVYWDCDGTTHRAWLNGTAQTLNADTGANNGDLYDDTTGEDVVSIGGLKHTSETNHAGVVLYEIYNHPLKLTDASRAKIAAYVLRNYGLTL